MAVLDAGRPLHFSPGGLSSASAIIVQDAFEFGHLQENLDLGCGRPTSPVLDDSEYGALKVAVRTKEIYRSAPDGDRWLLVCDPDNHRVFVRHEPNLSSGGQISDIEIGSLLLGTGSGPESKHCCA
jgi:hypothetical protein